MCDNIQRKQNSNIIFKEIQGILFDVGGTLYLSKEFDRQFPLQLEKLLADKLSISIDEACDRLTKRIEKLSKTENNPTKVRAMNSFGIERDEVHNAFCQVNPKNFLKPNPSVKILLKKLFKDGFKLAILSNFRMILVKQILESLDFNLNLFDFILTEDEGLPIKPAKEPFVECINKFGFKAENLVYIGDSLKKDMEPAKSVGMKTIWIKSSWPEKTLPKSVDMRLNNIIELDDLLLS